MCERERERERRKTCYSLQDSQWCVGTLKSVWENSCVMIVDNKIFEILISLIGFFIGFIKG